jgi:DNA-directed RNA polymerase specialized sigma24 family protein
MEPEQAASQLPTTYRQVLAWLDEGCSHDEIAARLALDPSAVASLIELAKAKLARLTEQQ